MGTIHGGHLWRFFFFFFWGGINGGIGFFFPRLFPFPFFFFETPLQSRADHSKSISFIEIRNYLTPPALWTVAGLLSAVAAQTAYIFLSGNAGNADAFASSFVSDLLWYRLWPN